MTLRTLDGLARIGAGYRSGDEADGVDVARRRPDAREAAVTRPTIQAILEDGPRAGETVQLNVEHEDSPPTEFLLADEHLGARSAEESRRPPSGSVSTYRLSTRDEERGAYIYRVAPRE